MAVELASAYISLLPSFRGAEGAIQRDLSRIAGRAGTQAGAQFGNEFGTAARSRMRGLIPSLSSIGKGAAGIGAAALAGAAGLAKLGLEGAASLQTTTTAFTSLLGSSKAATDQIAQLQAFAAKTPFSQQDVFSYAQQYFALADSIGLAKDQVQPFLTTVGNIAAVTGASTENIHNAVLAIGQIGSAGKVTLENLNQISEAFPGFNGAAAIAAATGQKTSDVLKEISAGSIDATTGVQALLVGMQKFPGAAGAMAKQSQTLAGTWSTFTDTLQIKLTQAFTPLIPQITSVLNDLVPVISNALAKFAPAITGLVRSVLPILQPLITGLGDLFTVTLRVFGPAMAAISPLIQPLVNALTHILAAVSPLVTLFAQIAGQVGPPLLAIFGGLAAALSPIVQAIAGALVPVLPILSQTLTQVGAALAPVVQQLSGAFVAVIGSLAPVLPDLARSFGSMAVSLAKILAALAPAITLFGKLAALGLGPILKAMAKGAELLSDALGGITDGISSVTSGLQVLSGATVESSAGLDASTGSAIGLAAALAYVADAMDQVSQRSIANDKQQIAAARNRTAEAKAAKKNAPKIPAFKIPTIPTPGAPALPAFDAGTLKSFFQQAAGTTTNPLTSALNAILASAKAAGKKLSNGVVATLRSQNADLIRLTNERDKVAQRLQGAQQHLTDLIQQRNQEASTIKQAVTSGFDVGNLPKPQFGEPITLVDIMRRLAKAVANARSFNSVLRRLARAGLPATLLRQLAEAGPDALPAARALLSATPKQLGQIRSQFRQLTTQGASIGKFVANDMFKSGIDAAEGLVKGLKSKQSQLNHTIRNIARTMVREMRRELDMHSPSKRLFKEAALAFEGYRQGIASKHDAIGKEAKRVANGSVPESQMRNWQHGLAAAAGRTINLTQNIHNPIPEPASRTTPDSIRRAAYALGR
jgi:tape measure domain-containing protein